MHEILHLFLFSRSRSFDFFRYIRIGPSAIIFVKFVAKHFRQQDTKTQRLILANSFALRLCAFVAIFPARPGWVLRKNTFAISLLRSYHILSKRT
jgi:hypothetical protein